MKRTIEILAPAGNPESLSAALRCGANAVYIGGKHFSARNNATNFDISQIKDAANLCHLYSAKLYLAVNTIIFDSEVSDFCQYIKDVSAFGIDAFIVQDLGCAQLIKQCVPDAVLHASTQMSVHSPKGTELLKELGFSRVVPARELNAQQIADIAKVGLEVEAFVHGALCMSVSGQCYMSAMIGSRSANRGGCAQACRLPFSACGNKSSSCLSLKDLSLLQHIQQLSDTGVFSMKIEGRMKRPEYVAFAVTSLKNAIDGIAPDMQTLRSIFSRDGFTDAYFTGKYSDMFGTRIKSDVVASKDILPDIRKYYEHEPKLYKIDFSVSVKNNMPVEASARCQNILVSVSGTVPPKALNHPTDLPFIQKQFSKLGNTVFESGTISAQIDEGLAVSASTFNELRRNAVEIIQDKIVEANTPTYNISDFIPNKLNVEIKSVKPAFRSHCSNIEQAVAANEFSEFIVLPMSECISASKSIPVSKIIAEPPRFISNEQNLISELKTLFQAGIRHLLCVNLAFVTIGRQLGFTLHGAFGLNIANSYSTFSAADIGLSDITLSFEPKLSQLSEITSPIPCGIIAYGKLPLMLTKNCPIKNEIGCDKCTHCISDRTERVFPIKCCGNYVEILNSDTLFLADKASDLSQFKFISLIFFEESPEEVISVINQYSSNRYCDKPRLLTRGLYYRGVE